MPKVNCGIVCGDGRDQLTDQCIRSYFRHTNTDLYTLTILANNVPHTTENLLRDLWQEYDFEIKWFRESLGGGAVTNRLMESMWTPDAEYLYHTAADFYFYPGWLEALLAQEKLMEVYGIGLMGAYSHPYHLTNRVIRGEKGYEIHLKDMVAGGSWFMPWETWEKYGPLNELHKGCWIGSEDSEFNFKLIADGMGRATIWPEMVVHTGRTASNGQPTLGAECMPDVPGVIIL